VTSLVGAGTSLLVVWGSLDRKASSRLPEGVPPLFTLGNRPEGGPCALLTLMNPVRNGWRGF